MPVCGYWIEADCPDVPQKMTPDCMFVVWLSDVQKKVIILTNVMTHFYLHQKLAASANL